MKYSALILLYASGLVGCSTFSDSNAELTRPLAGAAIFCDTTSKTAYVVIPILESKCNGNKVLAAGREVLGVRFEYDDEFDLRTWQMSADIADLQGRVDYGPLFGVVEPYFKPYERSAAPFGQNFNPVEQIISDELGRARHMSTLYPFTYDGNSVIMGSSVSWIGSLLLEYLMENKPDHGRVFIRYADGSEYSELIRVVYSETSAS